MRSVACILLLLGFVFLTAVDADACSCSLGNAENKLKNHPNVFVGTATKVERLDEKNGWDEQRIRVHFDVEKRWKGDPGDNILDTWDNKVTCEGFWFKEGRKYIVYARNGSHGFTVRSCGGAIVKTEEKGQFEKELEYLDKQPFAGEKSPSPTVVEGVSAADRALFKAVFETCDLKIVADLITADFEFYHDKWGQVASSRAEFVAAIGAGCERQKTGEDFTARRELIESTVKTFPMNNYGAVQTGEHRFFRVEKGKQDVLTEKSVFTHLWKLEDGKWRLARVFSFDHKSLESSADRESAAFPK